MNPTVGQDRGDAPLIIQQQITNPTVTVLTTRADSIPTLTLVTHVVSCCYTSDITFIELVPHQCGSYMW